MKIKNCVLLLNALFILIAFNVNAQNTSSKTVIKLDQNAQVRGVNGAEYPYAVWSKLRSSGKYGFKLIDKKNPEAPIFLIYPLSSQEVEARFDKMPRPMDSDAIKDGDAFEYFSFRNTEGKKFKIDSLKGKVLVLNFWFINCAPCRQEIPALNELVEQYKNNDKVVFIAVGLDPWFEVKDFLKDTPFNYHLVTDSRGIANSFKISGYPTNVVVGKDGKVLFQSKGGSSLNPFWMRKSINAELGIED